MKFNHEHDLIYHVKCPEGLCTDECIGESGRRVIERVKDHNGREKSSHMLKLSLKNNHTEVTVNDFKVINVIIETIRETKIAKALLIKQF